MDEMGYTIGENEIYLLLIAEMYIAFRATKTMDHSVTSTLL